MKQLAIIGSIAAVLALGSGARAQSGYGFDGFGPYGGHDGYSSYYGERGSYYPVYRAWNGWDGYDGYDDVYDDGWLEYGEYDNNGFGQGFAETGWF